MPHDALSQSRDHARYGAPDVLEIVEDDLRDARAGEVRVKVLAAGVSWADYMMRQGAYPGQPRPPFTPGYDVVASFIKKVTGRLGPSRPPDTPQLQGHPLYAQPAASH